MERIKLGKIQQECIPVCAQELMVILRNNGYQAYLVGGCVRDTLMGKDPKDWDICTDATPEQMKSVFHDRKTIETGLKPDSVAFVSSLEEDLSRRDFTVNAMAYYQSAGIIDPFHGSDDLENRIIRCVGDPDARFHEDALRILRALRFSSVFSFDIEKDTAAAIHRNAALLDRVSAERIKDELCKILAGENVLGVLLEYSDVIAQIIPEIKPCIGFEQHNRYHQYTVYGHIAHAVANYHGDDNVVNVALLLHDIGKPQCYTEDERGGHFHGHGAPSAEIASRVVDRLKFSRAEQEAITELVLYHDSVIEPQPKVVRRWLNKIGEDRFMQLLDIRLGDILAHAEGTQESRLERRNALSEIAKTVIAEEQCFKMRDLAVNGDDIMRELGLKPGKEVGAILRVLLERVISGDLQNTQEVLLAEAHKVCK